MHGGADLKHGAVPTMVTFSLLGLNDTRPPALRGQSCALCLVSLDAEAIFTKKPGFLHLCEKQHGLGAEVAACDARWPEQEHVLPEQTKLTVGMKL